MGGNSTREVMNIRDRLGEYYNTPEGRAPWQDKLIHRDRRQLQ